MGFKKGKGLGREQQGRSEAISVELRQSRRGLGAEKTGLEPSLDVTWENDDDEVHTLIRILYIIYNIRDETEAPDVFRTRIQIRLNSNQ